LRLVAVEAVTTTFLAQDQEEPELETEQTIHQLQRQQFHMVLEAAVVVAHLVLRGTVETENKD
jgi:hypothetical protein